MAESSLCRDLVPFTTCVEYLKRIERFKMCTVYVLGNCWRTHIVCISICVYMCTLWMMYMYDYVVQIVKTNFLLFPNFLLTNCFKLPFLKHVLILLSGVVVVYTFFFI